MKGAVPNAHEAEGASVSPPNGSGEPWERFLTAEYRNLLARQRGQLRLALGTPLPGESEEEIEWMVQEDQRRAEDGLVELNGKDGIYYKRLERLTPEDRTERLSAETERYGWLMGRMEQRTRLIRENWQQSG